MDSQRLDGQILRILEQSSRPLKAREIAAAIKNASGELTTRRDINSRLYSSLQPLVEQDSSFRWRLVGSGHAAQTTESAVGRLARLSSPPTQGGRGRVKLTAEQNDVVTRGALERLLVIAPAGTGKTQVLLKRIEYLVEAEELHAGDQVLVLTFSRAVVREVRRRLKNAEGAARRVRVSTFDSFATRLLSLVVPDDEWAHVGYDGRIEACSRMLREHESAREEIAQLGHVLIDEVQDLVGCRAALVLDLLGTCEGGFTLFGDPAQSIYGFQLRDAHDGMTSDEFFAALRAKFRSDLKEAHFSVNYRARSDVAKAVLPFGERLSAPDADFDEILPELEEFTRDVLPSISLDELLPFLPRMLELGRHVAILCRTNGQALKVSGRLHEVCVPHRLQRRAVDRAVAPWIAAAFGPYRGQKVARDEFDALVGGCGLRSPSMATDELWRAARRTARMDEKGLDLCRLAAGIRAGYVDDELCELPPAALVVSSIHRAKGLEFDDVFVTEPAQGPEPADVGEECRILYVGLTRARDEVEMLDLARTWGLHRSDRYDHRWQWTGAQAWMRRGIEFLGTDVDCERPAFGGSRELEDLADWARYASGRLQPGEAVQLSHGAGSDGFYDVLHDGVKIGQTSVDFKQALDSFLFFKQQKKRRYPTSIEDLHVEMVDSVAGTSADAERYGLGPAALWLRPRLVGLGRFVWG